MKLSSSPEQFYNKNKETPSHELKAQTDDIETFVIPGSPSAYEYDYEPEFEIEGESSLEDTVTNYIVARDKLRKTLEEAAKDTEDTPIFTISKLKPAAENLLAGLMDTSSGKPEYKIPPVLGDVMHLAKAYSAQDVATKKLPLGSRHEHEKDNQVQLATIDYLIHQDGFSVNDREYPAIEATEPLKEAIERHLMNPDKSLMDTYHEVDLEFDRKIKD